MVWVSSGTDRESVLSILPDIAADFSALYASLWTQPHLPADVLELCRLRLAQLHRCELEWQRSERVINPEKRTHLSAWHTHECFTSGERACLEFTEVYAMDPQALTDAQAVAIKAHFDDAGLVLLVEALGILDGMTRLSLLWDLPADAEPSGEPR
jgi:alkylhydroperoxidase family enzyme